MQISEGAMIGTVLTATPETFLMRSFMGVRQLIVELPVVAVAVVVIVRKGRHNGRDHE
ncbi:MAG TPA: hypothetical protein VGD54_02885 [Steroidobacteraceae bacterium]